MKGPHALRSWSGVRAERCLLKCRGSRDGTSFAAAADSLRDAVQAVADNRRNAADLVEQIVADSRRLRFVE
jgi:hypothetical protein